MSKVDQRKTARNRSGANNRGTNAFAPALTSAEKEQKRIECFEAAVALGLARDAEQLTNGQYPVRHNRLRMSFRVKGSKVS